MSGDSPKADAAAAAVAAAETAKQALMSLPPEKVKALLLEAVRTHDVELSCESTYELLDEYAELAARGEDPTAVLPLVGQHFEICGECCEEYELLLKILQSPAEEPDTSA